MKKQLTPVFMCGGRKAGYFYLVDSQNVYDMAYAEYDSHISFASNHDLELSGVGVTALTFVDQKQIDFHRYCQWQPIL